MVKRMLVDANHPEETRVVVLDGTRLEEFDLETSTKKQNKGNIYLAKVVRVEPSLQAAFVDYGGNRHGFLAFSEIHPDYYQIPVADREALLAEAKAHDEEFHDDPDEKQTESPALEAQSVDSNPTLTTGEDIPAEQSEATSKSEQDVDVKSSEPNEPSADDPVAPPADVVETAQTGEATKPQDPTAQIEPTTPAPQDSPTSHPEENSATPSTNDDSPPSENDNATPPPTAPLQVDQKIISDTAPVGTSTDATTDASNEPSTSNGKSTFEEVGGEDEADENVGVQRRKFVASRRYKIQEVIKRRQILLIQVVKEERGNKGAALTTYLSLAGRYCVLMPNSSRGGGVSRKITNVKDRRRLKSIVSDLKISEHMAVILRTAGAERSKAEVKRDFEYLQRTWNQIREVTMESRAPALIHEEANLIKRSIRDIYSKDIEEIFVEGEEGYKAAKEFMKTLTPSHAKKVKRYKDDIIPLLHRYQVESQLDAMHLPTVQLKSGGSIVFGQTEALVAIDVNSGRATKERHIEETALKTNIEAADEIARQLRLRDLAGLVVIDFIDMDENRNNYAVERRLKEALKSDRARIQVGRISHFGLLELSRQRLRPSLIEANFEVCKSCGGTGMIRSTESTAVQTLRAIEEEGLRNRTSELTVYVHPDVALYILNYKRTGLEEIQQRYDMSVYILGDSTLIAPDLRMEKVKGGSSPRVIEQKPVDSVQTVEDVDESVDIEKPEGESEGGRKRRRRRKRKRKDDSDQTTNTTEGKRTDDQNDDGPSDNSADSARTESKDSDSEDGEPQRKSRRRGRRGGRRRRREEPVNSDNAASSNSSSNVSEPQNSETPPSTSEQTTASDPIPAQPDPSAAPKPSSRFLDVFRRGADALKPSSSASKLLVVESQPEHTPTDAVAAKSEPQQAKSEPNAPDAKTSQSKPAAVVEEKPAGPPRRGWWNKDDAGS